MPEGASSTSGTASKSPSGAEASIPRAPPRRGGPKYTPSQEHQRFWKRVEWAWTLIPILLLAIVGIASAGLLYQLDTGPTAFGSQANFHVNVTGQQWQWTFQYTDPHDAPGAGVLPANATSSIGVLYVPMNAVVEVNVTSIDVVHDFNIPQLGVRIDAIPGIINHAWFVIPAGTAPWSTFRIQCTEFCGQGHYNMLATLVVTPYSANLPPS